jgi:sulfoxide reductase catalytic subunit YedY
VNPNVSRVRWDQSRERRLPSLFATTKTLMFNGYGDQVASMYQNLDLKKYY